MKGTQAVLPYPIWKMIFLKLFMQTIFALLMIAVFSFIVFLYLMPLEIPPEDARYWATVDGISSLPLVVIVFCGFAALLSGVFAHIAGYFEQLIFKVIFKQLVFLSFFRIFLIFVWLVVKIPAT